MGKNKEIRFVLCSKAEKKEDKLVLKGPFSQVNLAQIVTKNLRQFKIIEPNLSMSHIYEIMWPGNETQCREDGGKTAHSTICIIYQNHNKKKVGCFIDFGNECVPVFIHDMANPVADIDITNVYKEKKETFIESPTKDDWKQVLRKMLFVAKEEPIQEIIK